MKLVLMIILLIKKKIIINSKSEVKYENLENKNSIKDYINSINETNDKVNNELKLQLNEALNDVIKKTNELNEMRNRHENFKVEINNEIKN